MKRLTTTGLTLMAAMGIVACGEPTQPGSKLVEPTDQVGQIVPDQYIVVFDDDVLQPRDRAEELIREYGGELRFVYEHALGGFAAQLTPAGLDALQNDSDVRYIEPDREVQLLETQLDPPSWGLDRIDQLDTPLDQFYTYNNDASGANVYILDTGVRLSHSEFGGRAQYVPNGNNGDFVNDGHGSAADCHGHGTHVSGTAAGTNFGVAKNAAVWAGRVVNCAGSGQVSMAIAGVDWVTANAVRPAVVNMSLGYGNVQSLRDAVQSSVAGGVSYSVAAGNGNFFGRPLNACYESPAGAPDALTVGATQSNDAEASFSNYGPCVDFLAPGVNITSAWHTSDNATNTISGTSMATPHVTGAVAQYLSANPDHTPAQAADALVGNAVPNTIALHGRSRNRGTPNLLLNVEFIGPAGNQIPNASFTVSCDLLTCTFDGSGSSDADGAIASYGWTFGDGGTGSGVTAIHTYSMDGTYAVTLTVIDDEGAEGSEAQDVSVSGVPNTAPTAFFTFSCDDLNCDFDASGSFDSDGSIVSYSWNFGDGSTGTGPVPSHTYGTAGTYTATLTVVDDDTATDTVSDEVTVTAPPPPTIVLTASGFSFFGIKVAELSWSPVTSANIDIYRNGSFHDSGPNIGMYSEIHTTPGRQFSYFVCEAGTSVCSNTVTLVY